MSLKNDHFEEIKDDQLVAMDHWVVLLVSADHSIF